MILLNDNTPYDLSPIEEAMERYRGCDLLAVNYNGGADDFPVCYRGLSDAEKENLCNQRDSKKLEANLRLIQALGPKAQGNGIYRSFIVKVMHWCHEEGLKRMELGPLVNNYAVQRVWQRLGFEIYASHTFHLWLENI